jgi:hypothetical protein
MQNLPLLSLVCLALLKPLVHGFFLGPVAVGAALGALFIGKGLILGAVLARGRTRRQSYRTRRSHDYQTSRHHSTKSNWGYTRSPSYYYAGGRQGRSYTRYGKREAMPVDKEGLTRARREIEESFDSGAWFLEMVEKDQDDCTKRLICELAARNASRPLGGMEAELSQAFGLGNAIDVSSPKAVFDMAAQTGRHMGRGQCGKFYKRCDTPVKDLLEMITTELEDFTKEEEELLKQADPMEAAKVELEREKEDLVTELGDSDRYIWN